MSDGVGGRWNPVAIQRAQLVAVVEVHEELGSTNDRAKVLAATEGVTLPALVVAERQTAGRGRGDHRWWAGQGALTFTLLIDPAQHDLARSQQGLLSLTTAVAVIDAVQATAGVACGYKWPNDVLLEGKKLAGILIESPRPDRLVIGVGINVENRLDEAPAEIRSRAASLASSTATRQHVLEAFLDAYSKRLAQLGSGDPSPLEAARAACVLTCKQITLRDGERISHGLCRGVANDGALLVDRVDGLERHHAGTIERFE